MNRRNFLKQSLALPFVSALISLVPKKQPLTLETLGTGTYEVTGLSFSPHTVIVHRDDRVTAYGYDDQAYDGYPSTARGGE